jgi:hypothetical protein
MTLEISKETKSKAYSFIKSLLQDGADGEQINALVNDMGEHLNKDIAGQILMDLLRNPEDADAEVKVRNHWFGPINQVFYKWIVNDWAEYCKENNMRGTFEFGNIEVWKRWRKAGGYDDISDYKLKEMATNSADMIMVFHWWADALQHSETTKWINELYEKIEERDDKRKYR